MGNPIPEPAAQTYTEPSVCDIVNLVKCGTRAIVAAVPEGILLKPVTAVTIRRLRGILRRKPGDKPFAEEWAEHKRQELELEEDKYVRSTGSR